MSKVGFVYDERMEEHEARYDHVEQPDRHKVCVEAMKRLGVTERCVQIKSRMATSEEILTGHSKEYAALLATSAGSSERYCRKLEEKYQHDVYFCENTHMAALLALGCTVEATIKVLDGTCRHACACVRPPGHHATCSKAMGFSFFNNVAISALLAANGVIPPIQQAKNKRRKVLVVDFDIHHGNGTQDMTYNDDHILYFSIHRGLESKKLLGSHPFYPGSGMPDDIGGNLARGFNVNIAWSEPGMSGAEYATAWLKVLLPIARTFAPDLILISAGFDGAMGDQLGQCKLLPRDYHAMCTPLAQLAPCCLSLEGGYNLNIIGECFAACAMALLGDNMVPPCNLDELSHGCDPTAAADINATIKAHAPFWSSLKQFLQDDIDASVDSIVNEMTGICLDNNSNSSPSQPDEGGS